MSKKILFVIFLFLAYPAYSLDITISESATYYDEKIIQTNIKNECLQLGEQFSDSTASALTNNGWSVIKQPNLNIKAQGINLKLEIVNALSSGNAFLGHKKLVAIQAELYKDGELIDSFTATRSSGGGFGGGFKGSCDILQRCVNTLGKDVTKWLSSKQL